MDNKEILAELGIDTKMMMADKSGFDLQCREVASKLRSTIGATASVGKEKERSIEAAKKSAPSDEVSKLSEFLSEYAFEGIEDLSSSDLYHLAQSLRKMADDVMNVHASIVRKEMVTNLPTEEERFDAIYHLEMLRDVHGAWRRFVKMTGDFDCKPIMGINMERVEMTRRYPVYVINGETYYSPRAVAKILGIDVEIANHADLMEYITEHPEFAEQIITNSVEV